MSEARRIVILGGGPCGIGAAVRLSELCHPNWILYEMEDRVGGLARSIPDGNGFLWDVGGHVIFSHYKYFDDVLEHLGPKERITLTRKCLIFMQDGKYEVNYPLQNHVDELPPELWQQCLEGLLDSYVAAQQQQESSGGERRRPSNFAEWGRSMMGDALVEIFLRPYNEKLWAWPMEEMSAEWLGERVAVPDFKKVMAKFTRMIEQQRRGGDGSAAAAAANKEGWGPNSVFNFALNGGTGAIWTSVAEHLPQDRLKCNVRATSVDPTNKVITLSDGTTDTYDVLINTVSLQTLATDLIVTTYSKKVLLEQLTSKLKFCSVIITGLGLQGPEPPRLDRFHWGYFPANDVPFYRCTVLSHYSPRLVPPDTPQGQHHYSLLFECSYSHHRAMQLNTTQLIAATETAARRYSLIDDNVQVVSRWSQPFHYGYPTPTTDRDSLLREIHKLLEPQQIYSRGRFGGWKYEVGNMDHSLMQGVEVVDRILQPDSPLASEPTYNSPNHVNNPQNRGRLGLNVDAILSITRQTQNKAATTEQYQELDVLPTAADDNDAAASPTAEAPAATSQGEPADPDRPLTTVEQEVTV